MEDLIHDILNTNTAAIPRMDVPEQQPEPEPDVHKPGGLKAYLSNALKAYGDNVISTLSGRPNSYYRDVNKQKIDISQQQADSLEQERQANTTYRNWQMEQQKQMVTLPNGMQVPYQVALKAFPDLLKQQAITDRTQGVLDSKESVANANRDSKESIAADQIASRQRIAEMVKANKLSGVGSSGARSDKSYQFHSGQLDKIATPLDAAIGRMGRLQDTLNQNNPQADALIAPELLTVMAGGQGSGLRMNEAEIARIVGGRSQWESLKASVNKWKMDPNSANSITPSQRQQIRALVTEVSRKMLAKQSILDDARTQLINTDDPGQHKRIYAGARSRLSSIDSGSSDTGSDSVRVQLSNGRTGTIPRSSLQKYISAGAKVIK